VGGQIVMLGVTRIREVAEMSKSGRARKGKRDLLKELGTEGR